MALSGGHGIYKEGLNYPPLEGEGFPPSPKETLKKVFNRILQDVVRLIQCLVLYKHKCKDIKLLEEFV